MTTDDRAALEGWINRILMRLELIGVCLQSLDPDEGQSVCSREARRSHATASTETLALKRWLMDQLAALRSRPLD